MKILNLLEKYIAYIAEIEGTDYITHNDNRVWAQDTKFTDEEWRMLEEISKRRNYPNEDKEEENGLTS